MKPCFGCDNMTCICSKEEIEWAIKNDPEGYERYYDDEV